MAKNIWVFCEQRDGELQNVSLELIGGFHGKPQICRGDTHSRVFSRTRHNSELQRAQALRNTQRN